MEPNLFVLLQCDLNHLEDKVLMGNSEIKGARGKTCTFEDPINFSELIFFIIEERVLLYKPREVTE